MDLSEGAVQALVSGVTGEANGSIVQVIAIKKVQPSNPNQQQANAPDRYRLALSDGLHYVPAMIAVQLNHLILEGQLAVHSVIRLDNYTCNNVQARRIVIVLSLDLISQEPAKIGNPINIDTLGTLPPPQSPALNQQQQQYEAPPQQQQQQHQQHHQQHQHHQQQQQHQQYGGQQRQQQQQPQGNSYKPQLSYGGGGYGGTQGGFGGDQNASPSSKTITPIARLNPYQNRWMIRARVTNKGPMKKWSNARGEGKLISIDLVDESGEIRCTGFHEVADKIESTVEIGKVYTISRGQIKNADKRWSTLNNAYELNLDRNAIIELCQEDTDAVPTIKYDFVPVANLEQHPKDAVVDIIGVIKTAQPITVITTRATGKQLPKRDLVLVDDSGKEVNLTLWGAQAENYNEEGCPVVVVKGAKVGDFGGRSLSAMNSSMVQYNPDMPEAHRLRGWYDSVGYAAPTTSLSTMGGGGGSGPWNDERMSIDTAKTRVLSSQDKPLYFITPGYIALIKKDNAYYKACPADDCNKKLIEQGGESYMCEKCGVERNTFKIRLMLSMSVVDALGQAWLTAFHEQGEQILGMSSMDLYDLSQANPEMYEAKFQEHSFMEGLFKIRVKMETYQDEQRPRFNLQGYKPLDYVTESHTLLADIRRLQNM